MAKTLNFDKFMQERERKNIEVTLFGEVYLVPDKIPAYIPLQISHAQMNHKSVNEIVLHAAEMMLGQKFMERLKEHPEFGLEDLENLIQSLFKLINGKEEESDTEEISADNGMVEAKPKGKK